MDLPGLWEQWNQLEERHAAAVSFQDAVRMERIVADAIDLARDAILMAQRSADYAATTLMIVADGDYQDGRTVVER